MSEATYRPPRVSTFPHTTMCSHAHAGACVFTHMVMSSSFNACLFAHIWASTLMQLQETCIHIRLHKHVHSQTDMNAHTAERPLRETHVNWHSAKWKTPLHTLMDPHVFIHTRTDICLQRAKHTHTHISTATCTRLYLLITASYLWKPLLADLLLHCHPRP